MKTLLLRSASAVRKLVRFVLGGVIWAHALFMFQVPDVGLNRFFVRLHTTTGEFFVIALILCLSILAGYGWGKVTVDVIYIYFFPFVLLFHCARLIVRLALKLSAFIKGNTASETSDVPYYAQLSLPVMVQTGTLAAAPSEPTTSSTAPKKSVGTIVGYALLHPFRRYVLLWCALLLLTTHRIFIYLALAIVLLHLVDLIIGVLKLSLTTNGWFTKISDNINRLVDEHMRKISAAKDKAVTQEVKNAWIALRGILKGVAYLRDRRVVAQWTIFLGFIAFVTIYVYLALLFSFAYYGISRLQNISWTWRDALITSSFLPIAYPDLPHTKLLRLAGGIQWICVLALGTSTVIGFFKQQLTAFHTIAENIGRRFEQDEVKTTIIVVNEKLAAEGPK